MAKPGAEGARQRKKKKRRNLELIGKKVAESYSAPFKIYLREGKNPKFP